MKQLSATSRILLLTVAISAVPVAFLQAIRLATGAPFAWAGLAALWTLVAGVLALTHWTRPYATGRNAIVWPWLGVGALGLGAGAIVTYLAVSTTWAAWLALFALYFLLLGLDCALADGASHLWRWGVHGGLVLLGGVVPVAFAQVESHFAEEEFFVSLQVLVLGVFTSLMLGVQGLLGRWGSRRTHSGLRLDRRWLALGVGVVAAVGLGAAAHTYQRSFYPIQAPAFSGISPENPFLCGEVPPDPAVYDSEAVLGDLMERLAANPYSGPPEFAMLALVTGERQWAQAFHESLLSEAAKGLFTGPAHSVKSVQYLAAQRAYYLPRIRAAFPELFSDDESAQLDAWFAAINRRALSVEPVDWMYGLAFSKWPEGPYENQENGAGLLALLETEDLAAPVLSLANQDYLQRNPRGWLARFRNTDDAYIYQPEWIDNAYFQSLYTGMASAENMGLSFEWLLLQALPDGVPLRYNHPYDVSLAGTAYLAAQMLGDDRYVWLAGRVLAASQARGDRVSAQPGAEQLVPLTGRSPTQGSCLLYGDSGLPNQAGPLAPDKIVFRDGWAEDAAYMLLNLRFTGWHRYKATNTVSLLYQGGPLVSDALDGESFSWLPEGRSAFRDKRIPRENLNGLLIPRSGMSGALYGLTSIGGPWAQDPPYYAEVVAFETAAEKDWSHTRLTDWRGWHHDRWIYFYHDGGPIVVVDSAQGPPGEKAALVWHLSNEGTQVGQRIRLRHGAQPAEVLLLAAEQGPTGRGGMRAADGTAGQLVSYNAPDDGRVQAITLFLLGEWVGAKVELDEEEQVLRVVQGKEQIALPLPMAGEIE